MASGILLKPADAADIATPPTGKVVLFLDQATGEPSTKDDAAAVVSLRGADGSPGATGAAGDDGADGQGVPTGGTTGQRLAKIDGTDFNTEWVDPVDALPVGGTTGQVLKKQSGTDGDADWEDESGGSAGTSPPGTPDIWFKADDASLTVNGSNEPTSIPNNGAFGGSFTLDAASTKRGTLVAAAQNGLAALRMDGTDDYLRMAFSSQTSASFTIFAAMRRRAAGSSQRRWLSMARSGVSDITASTLTVYSPDASATTVVYLRNSANTLETPTQANYYSPTILELGSDSVNSYLGLNGLMNWSSTADTNGIAALSVTDLFVGAGTASSPTAATFLPSDIFEVLVYFGTSALSQANRNAARAYLSKRWAIPALLAAA